jgi:hypothetical protein
MADETINFFMNYFVDHEYGEIYADRTRYGGFAWNEAKGNSGKAGYHSIETGYYTYLYGSLFYTNQPVTLHYNFYPLPTERELLLTPLAIKDTNLIIAEVLRDGQYYADFDPFNRILTLPAGVGGQFEVTYNTLVSNISSDAIATVDNFRLDQNYPNPFNPVTTIRYQIPEQSFTTLKVFDLLGREISTLVREDKSPGNYEVRFDASGLPSGIYFYKLQVGKFNETKKMILLK